MRILINCLILLFCTITQLCAQNDSLTQILDDVQEEDVNLNNWLEILSEQLIDQEQSALKKYPRISLTHRFQYTLEKNEALADHIFIGSPFESYTRMKARLYQNLATGILVQKDVGELSFTDHYAGYISWNHPNQAVKIILGNYYIRCGEGLLFSGPFSLPKMAFITKQSIFRTLQSRPFLSSNEYDGFGGGAIEIGDSKAWKFLLFYSKTIRDGILSDDNNYITGFERTGYHRTFTEANRANRISETSYGGAVQVPIFFLDKIGISYVKARYSPEIISTLSPEEKRRNFYKFYGSSTENFALFYAESFRTLHLSGELVPLKSKKIAYNTTLNFNPSEWHFILKSWYIPSCFRSSYGRIPSDSNPFPNSVQGFMFGTATNFLGQVKSTAFWSVTKELWRSYFQPLPTRKKEFYIQSEYQFGQKRYLLIRYHVNSSDFYSSDYPWKLEKRKHSIRIQIKKSFNTKMRIQTRFEKVFFKYSSAYPTKTGINFYQDFYWQPLKSISFRIRFSSFSTDDYDARLYEYENDLPYVFSNFALYGQGRKWYILFTVKPTTKLILWLKYRRITFNGVESIGSGLTKIMGDMRQDIHFQIELQY